MSEQDDELLEIFLDESREHLDGIEGDLLQIEEQSENVDDDLINKVFRAVHSIKGAAGFFGLTTVKELAHAAENVFGQIRKHELIPTSGIINSLLEAIDTLNHMIENPEESEDIDISAHLSNLKAILTGSVPEAKKELLANQVEIKSPDGRVVFTVSSFDLTNAAEDEKGGPNIYLLEYDLIKDIERNGKTPWGVISELLQMTSIIDSKLDFDTVGTLDQECASQSIPFYVLISTVMERDIILTLLDLKECNLSQISKDLYNTSDESGDSQEAEQVVQVEETVASKPEEKSQVATPVVATKPAPQSATPAPVKATKEVKPGLKKSKPTHEGSIRVNVKVLDKLMTLAGEMVLTRNQLLQSTAIEDMYLIDRATQRVDLITTELQDAIMSTRMQSIGIVFSKFKRLVHDLSGSLQKDIDLVLEGEDVELDKTIIESINDPLTHLVRNSIDHGIEMPDDRVRAGKKGKGTLRLSAYHKAGQVVIEVVDDGGGIDPDVIKEKALNLGMHTIEELDAMSKQAIIGLIFKPGFSTAQKVTDVSGRGVGMDVVNSNLSAIGGVVDIDSDVGKGTTINIKLPLTLAILPSLLVSVGSERYAIPQINLVELQRIPANEVATKVEKLGDVNVMRLRGELLPLIELRDVLGTPEEYKLKEVAELGAVKQEFAIEEGGETSKALPTDQAAQLDETPVSHRLSEQYENGYGAVNIAVVAAGDFHYGIILDNLLDSAEIVVKPLGRHLSSCRCYAGATILGDGKAALILDIIGICHKMEISEKMKRQIDQGNLESDISKTGQDAQILLMIENAPGDVFAVPLGLVERIEKININHIETVGGRRAIKYRNGSLTLISIEETCDVKPMEEDLQTLFVIIFNVMNREVGILASQILDIVDTMIEIDEFTFKQPGIWGSSIIEDKTVLILDIQTIAASVLTEIEPETLSVNSFAAAPTLAQPVEGEQKTVLVVEDSKFFLNQITEIAEDGGYKVLNAEDGLIALDVLNKNEGKISLVLTDIEMPNLDGFGLVERMRFDARFSNIPVIAVTSIMGEASEQRGKEVGIDEYLIKLDREKILEKSKHFVENGRSITV